MTTEASNSIKRGQMVALVVLGILMGLFRDRFEVQNAVFFTIAAFATAVTIFGKSLLRTPFSLIILALVPATIVLLQFVGINSWKEINGRDVAAIVFFVGATWLGILTLAAKLTNRTFLQDDEDAPSDVAPPLDQ